MQIGRIAHSAICGCCDMHSPAVIKEGCREFYTADLARTLKAAGWKLAWKPAR